LKGSRGPFKGPRVPFKGPRGPFKRTPGSLKRIPGSFQMTLSCRGRPGGVPGSVFVWFSTAKRIQALAGEGLSPLGWFLTPSPSLALTNMPWENKQKNLVRGQQGSELENATTENSIVHVSKESGNLERNSGGEIWNENGKPIYGYLWILKFFTSVDISLVVMDLDWLLFCITYHKHKSCKCICSNDCQLLCSYLSLFQLLSSYTLQRAILHYMCQWQPMRAIVHVGVSHVFRSHFEHCKQKPRPAVLLMVLVSSP